MRERLTEAEETLRAIRKGDVDSLVVETDDGDRVFTLWGADQAYRIMIEKMSEGVVTLNENGTILFANQRFSRLVKTRLERVLGASIYDFIAADSRATFFVASLRRNGQRREISLRADDGGLVPVMVTPTSFNTREFTAILLLVTDLTEQKHAEEELRSLSRRLVQVQEEERRHVARELHDEVGQLLTYVGLLLGRAQSEDGKEAALTEAKDIVARLVAQIGSLSLNLRPAIVFDLGLVPGLMWLIERYTSETGITVEFRHDNVPKKLPTDLAIAAYRILQEALTNVARHADADEAHVRISAKGKMLHAQIRDAGRGFLTDRKRLGAGLSGMRERARSLGGFLTVQSTPGAGSVIDAYLPLGRARNDHWRDEPSQAVRKRRGVGWPRGRRRVRTKTLTTTALD